MGRLCLFSLRSFLAFSIVCLFVGWSDFVRGGRGDIDSHEGSERSKRALFYLNDAVEFFAPYERLSQVREMRPPFYDPTMGEPVLKNLEEAALLSSFLKSSKDYGWVLHYVKGIRSGRENSSIAAQITGILRQAQGKLQQEIEILFRREEAEIQKQDRIVAAASLKREQALLTATKAAEKARAENERLRSVTDDLARKNDEQAARLAFQQVQMEQMMKMMAQMQARMASRGEAASFGDAASNDDGASQFSFGNRSERS